jgi:transposase
MTSLHADDRLFEVGTAESPEREALQPAGRDKTFRPYDQHQTFLLPPSLDDWLPAQHTARFISETVESALDLSLVYDSYANATGAPPFDPAMMTKLLLYGYSIGVTSSREIERRCSTDVAFRWLGANAVPDYRSISRFRRRHLGALEDLFTQVLVLCQRAGLVGLGRVALDGTKVRAAASRHKAMSYDRMGRRVEELRAEVRAMLAAAEATDLAEDEEFGEDRRGDELPPELATKEARLRTILAAKEAIEAEAREKATREATKKAVSKGASPEAIERAGEEAANTAPVNPRAQRNFTDPDARIMKTADGSFHYCYNAQAVVDEHAQVILSTSLVQDATDVNQLAPMIIATTEQLKRAGVTRAPRLLLADAGYCSTDNIDATAGGPSELLIATGRQQHGERVTDSPRGRIPTNATSRERMARRLRTKSGRADYARRKAIVEPVFGQMKVRQRAGQFRLRGLEGTQGEWTLHALCHNLRKLANANSLGVLATS